MTTYQLDLSTANSLVLVVSLAFFIWIAYKNLKAAQFSKMSILLECTRLSFVILVLISLMNPIRIHREERERKPSFHILRDISGSMQTADIKTQAGKIETRAELLKRVAPKIAFKELEEKYEVSIIDFEGQSGKAKATDISAAIRRSLDNSEGLHGILLLSDGSWNTGENPAKLAEYSKIESVPIYTVGFGQQDYLPDLLFEEIELPSFGIVKEKVVIPFAVRNHLGKEFNGIVRLNTGIETLEKVVSIPAGASVSDNFIWQASYEGEFDFSLELPSFNSELDKKNNRIDFKLDVRKEVLKVLIVESLPRWEYRYMRNAMMRDPGVELKTYLLHQAGMKIGGGTGYLPSFPNTVEELSKYDVIFLGDVGMGNGMLNEKQLKLVKGVVQNQGTGLVFLPGMMGHQLSFQKSPIKELLPVVYDDSRPEGVAYNDEVRFELSGLGSEHLLTRLSDTSTGNYALWKVLPGFYWSAAVKRAKIGSQVLGEHALEETEDGGKMPILAIASRSNGHVLYLGTDSAWRWRRGVEDKYHYRFWGQVVRWMSNRRHSAYSENVRLFMSPNNPQENSTLEIQVTVFDDDNKALDNRQVNLELIDANGKTHKTPLLQKETGWGVYHGKYTVDSAGEWTLRLDVKDTDITYEKKFFVKGRIVEKQGLPASLASLKEISRISSGRYYQSHEFKQGLKEIIAMPLPSPQEIRWRLLSQWWWGAIIILLATLYWILRKKQGLI